MKFAKLGTYQIQDFQNTKFSCAGIRMFIYLWSLFMLQQIHSDNGQCDDGKSLNQNQVKLSGIILNAKFCELAV